MVTSGEEPAVGLTTARVSVRNGYTWRGGWGRPDCQVGMCQQWSHVEIGLGWAAWLPSGLMSAMVICREEPKASLVAKWVSQMVICGEQSQLGLVVEGMNVRNDYM